MKTDKGFEINYWKLNYRRKLIRTLWLIPFVILASVLVWYNYEAIYKKVITILILIIILVVQLIYNYKQYQKDKR